MIRVMIALILSIAFILTGCNTPTEASYFDDDISDVLQEQEIIDVSGDDIIDEYADILINFNDGDYKGYHKMLILESKNNVSADNRQWTDSIEDLAYVLDQFEPFGYRHEKIKPLFQNPNNGLFMAISFDNNWGNDILLMELKDGAYNLYRICSLR